MSAPCFQICVDEDDAAHDLVDTLERWGQEAAAYRLRDLSTGEAAGFSVRIQRDQRAPRTQAVFLQSVASEHADRLVFYPASEDGTPPKGIPVNELPLDEVTGKERFPGDAGDRLLHLVDSIKELEAARTLMQAMLDASCAADPLETDPDKIERLAARRRLLASGIVVLNFFEHEVVIAAEKVTPAAIVAAELERESASCPLH